MHKIGILGGTFDPIHNGHMYMARAACDELGLDRVLIIPAGKPYFKGNITPYEMRCDMVKAAISDYGYKEGQDGLFEISYLESDTDKPTYTYETLGRLHENLSDSEFYFICGTDVFDSIGSWKRPEEVLEMAIICVFARSSDVISEESALTLKRIYSDSKHIFLNTRIPDISSTQIRGRIADGLSVEDLVSPSVAEYIITNGLYK